MHYAPIIPRPASSVSLPELVGAFSYALDITEGQPAGHAVRSAWIGSHVGEALGLGPAERNDLHYMLLLKDLGCSSNAARICELYEADDLAFKRGYKTVGTSLSATLRFVFERTAARSSLRRRVAALGNILHNGKELAQELILARCTRGADIARTLGFSLAVCTGIYHLDEHWDGSGRPDRLRGEAIPLFSRIALLAQAVDVFATEFGRAAALDEVRRRSGSWLDPQLVRTFEAIAGDDRFWAVLDSPAIDACLAAREAQANPLPVDEDFLDAIAAAFGQVVDAKSPFTAGHSRRVADFGASIAELLDVPASRRRWLHRAALLHDIGKLGVSNAILDKPGSLDEEEWRLMRGHAAHTQEILGRIGALRDLAPVAAAHHERLDGAGYPLGLAEMEIGRETRIITACDYFDALTADRPYRKALPLPEALAIMKAEVGRAIDPVCFSALHAVATGEPAFTASR
jgi:HD-GYP domain-containing protein (c-di-GMP phosphodiesterase class II)